MLTGRVVGVRVHPWGRSWFRAYLGDVVHELSHQMRCQEDFTACYMAIPLLRVSSFFSLHV